MPNERVALPSTRRSLPIALIRAREAVMAPIREMLAGTGLTEQQWRVLRVLDEFGPMDASRLAREAGLMASSLTRIVQAMMTDGLVTRETSASDRRRQVVGIASRGRKVLSDNRDAALAIAKDLHGRLGERDFERLLDLLEALAEVGPRSKGSRSIELNSSGRG
ncbi:MAG: homoprotocatechuate degradation operon regulator HpaR [Boseongicola sp.]|nr:homoprotocatechuate degradation operon regulator HpaR [Boseongicola sp.]